jgi:hypothetical protein
MYIYRTQWNYRADNKNGVTVLAYCVALSLTVRRLKQENKGIISNCAFLMKLTQAMGECFATTMQQC